MPKRTDIKKIMLIGSGPIVIGQACEFDYSGTQACKVLREDGYEVILVNSNPATIMTDPEIADRTYIEPLTPEVLTEVIKKERPDALLPTLGGQTALNLAITLAEQGVLEKYNVELIGAKMEVIKKAEDRKLFKKAMESIGLDLPRSSYIYSMNDALAMVEELGFPLVIRPSFTLGGTGGGIAYNLEELEHIVSRGLYLSPVGEVLVEESIIGWKEFELEVMRDLADNVVIVCSIENLDPMGIHTGDSITVAPAQTLTDREYHAMRDAALEIIREIGVETGGSNIQFAVNPEDGRMVIIEMNPRVSRSSALASKATGFPIAKIAAKLAVGYLLEEIPNDITLKTPSCFEPSIDYVVVKVPRFTFEKFPGTDVFLTTQMKSVGEAMAMGSNFKEALQKALRSLEIGRSGLGADGKDGLIPSKDELKTLLGQPLPQRLFHVRLALLAGISVSEICRLSGIDPWFIDQIEQIINQEKLLEKHSFPDDMPADDVILMSKQMGFSDIQLAHILGTTEKEIKAYRESLNIRAVYKTVDTCAGEFEAHTPYYYSTFQQFDEVKPSSRPKVIILGSGPNRIGQGIEFDYACVHASFALRETGFESIMVNCNPETVSTDYDTSDRLYFEPLTFEDVMSIVEKEKPIGVILQFGGQTPLKLAKALEDAGVPVLGTAPESIDLAEDRERFGELLDRLSIPMTPYGTARSFAEAQKVADNIGYPVLVRPSYVLGGRAMEIVYSPDMLESYIAQATEASPDHPILIDKFLEDATEVDVDALFDGETLLIGGIMEHIEEAGIHSGDSACVLPPHNLKPEIISIIREYTDKITRALEVKGLINFQFAVKGSKVYVLEVNPRASRTVPFVGKATGLPLAKLATKIIMGEKLADLGVTEVNTPYISVKEVVLPFNKFPGVDILLGPEMRSTGEVMGVGYSVGEAFSKAQSAAGAQLPSKGKIFLSIRDGDKRSLPDLAKRLHAMKYELIATEGTQRLLEDNGIPAEPVSKVTEGRPGGKPHIVDRIRSGEVALVINIPEGKGPRVDGSIIRKSALEQGMPCITTISAARAAVSGMEAFRSTPLKIASLQELHPKAVPVASPISH